MFRANKGLLNGVKALAWAWLMSSRIFELLRKSKLWRGKKSMWCTCLAQGFHSHTSHTIQKKRFVISLYIAIPSIDCGWAQKGSGLFQSKIILSTLSLHFTATNTLKDNMMSTKNPEGALLLSVVAISHFPQIYDIQYLTSLGYWQNEWALN